jgi:hypothetical protein
MAPAPIKGIVTLEVPAKTLTSAKPAPKKIASGGSTTKPEEARCEVPKLTGRRLAAAKKALRAASYKVGFVIRAGGVKASGTRVRRAVPGAGADLPPGTPVSLKVG